MEERGEEGEGDPVGGLGIRRGNSMAEEQHPVDGTAEEEHGAATKRGGGTTMMMKKLTMRGTGPTKGIWPTAILTEVAAAAAICNEGHAFNE
jgi:hypothetical protein